MYAGPPKIAQELFFWSYHPTKENILFLRHTDIYNHTPVIHNLVKLEFFTC